MKNDTEAYLTGFLRHTNVFLCPAHAQALYLIIAFGKEPMRTFPDVFDPEKDWARECYLVTNRDGKPLEYSRNKKKKVVPTLKMMACMKYLKKLKSPVDFRTLRK